MKSCTNFLSVITCLLLLLPLHGQGKAPLWVSDAWREAQYPVSAFYTGFAIATVPANRSVEATTEQATAAAKSELAEKIRLKVTSQKSVERKSVVNHDLSEQFREQYASSTYTEAQAEVVGMKVESYHDVKEKKVYAFAFVNRHELIGYYKNSLLVSVGQIESFVKTAQELEASSEKVKARQQLDVAKPLFSKVRYAQDLLTAIDANASLDDLQQAKTESLYSQLTQMQARLAQGVYVYVESEESNFAKLTTVVENRVKAALAKKGCSFVHSPMQADFQLYITAATRYYSSAYSFATCYADVQLSLVDSHKKKSIFKDEFSQKGVAATKERAGSKALEDAAPAIVEKISAWIE